MKETKKTYKNLLLTTLVLIVLVLGGILTKFIFQTKELRISLKLAENKIAADSLLILQYRKADEELMKFVNVSDNDGLFSNKKENVVTFLDTLFKSYVSEKNALEKQYKEKLIEKNELKSKIAHLETLNSTSQNEISYINTDLITQMERVDSISAELEKIEFELSQTVLDSLILYSPNGVKISYFGKIYDNKPKDFGIGFYEGKGHYIGAWKGNLRHGWGRHTFKDNSVYEGYFENDLRNGYGVYYYSTGEVYKGNWKDDLMNGRGEIVRVDGSIVEVVGDSGKLIQLN